ncbi:MAG: ribonuclease HII [Clostridiales bacterium]|nr:MAG: ribonuclease HII [Clostridiales bacterium]
MERDFFSFEREAAQQGLVMAGADEAGRGPLAGPVVAAAVIMDSAHIIEGINDSKKLSEKKREALYEDIAAGALSWSVGIVDVDVIEEINILNAARLAFQKAVTGLSVKPDYLYADYITGLELEIPYTPIVKGDAKVYSIAAASIVAKVTRDRIMREYDKKYPEYGFGKHKGYGTKQHICAIMENGPTEIHRMSFLRKILQ